MLRVIRVTGESLSPQIREGDYVVITTIPFFLNRLRPGDVIVFRHPSYGVMIKRVERVLSEGDTLFVIGDHPHSLDSRRFGPVPRRDVVGKMVWHIARPGKGAE
jgi:nickel-type superoxide dismutase maturation protease